LKWLLKRYTANQSGAYVAKRGVTQGSIDINPNYKAVFCELSTA